MSAELPGANPASFPFEVKGDFPPLTISKRYKWGLVAVAALMLLLPLLYLALNAGVAWLVWYHIENNAPLADSVFLFQKLLYFVPLACGIVLLLIMLKPLFLILPKKDEFIELRTDDAPYLFEFVRQISTALHVPPPTRIRLDMQANASAAIENRLLIIRRTTLVLGISLLAGLGVRELAGVIAHEVCHMSQRSAMRLSALIRRINYRFAYAVYGRSVINELIDTHEIGPLSIVIGPARLCVWLTRGILWGLMYTGYTLSHFLLHQMELEADRCAARIAGSDVYDKLDRHLVLMAAAIAHTINDLNQSLELEKVPDHTLPLLEANRELCHAIQLPMRRTEYLHNSNKYLRTHPPHDERVAESRAEHSEGLIHVDAPASALFVNFPDLVDRFVTEEWFRKALAKFPKQRANSREVLRALAKDDDALHGFVKFIGLRFSPVRPLPLNFDATPILGTVVVPATVEQYQALHAQHSQQRAALHAVIADGRAAYDEFGGAYAKTIEARVLAVMDGSENSAPFLDEVLCAQEKLLPLELRMQNLLLAFVRASYFQEVQARLPENQAAARIPILRTLETLGAAAPQIAALRAEHFILSEAACRASLRLRTRIIEKRFKGAAERLAQKLKALAAALGKTPYPFEHTNKDLTLKKFALPYQLEKHELFEVLQKCDGFLDRLTSVYFRALNRCAALAAATDSAIAELASNTA